MKPVFIFLVVGTLSVVKCEVAEEMYINLKKKSDQIVPVKSNYFIMFYRKKNCALFL